MECATPAPWPWWGPSPPAHPAAVLCADATSACCCACRPAPSSREVRLRDAETQTEIETQQPDIEEADDDGRSVSITSATTVINDLLREAELMDSTVSSASGAEETVHPPSPASPSPVSSPRRPDVARMRRALRRKLMDSFPAPRGRRRIRPCGICTGCRNRSRSSRSSTPLSDISSGNFITSFLNDSARSENR